MRLLLFPAYPSNTNGYGIAVKADIERIGIRDDDIVIWYVSQNKNLPENNFILKRYDKFSWRRIINLLKGYGTTEVSCKELKPFYNPDIDEIFCGEVVFYRALRELFPDKKITVRFHNCFARIRDRIDLLNTKKEISLLYRTSLKAFYNLERDVFHDDNTFKIFISKEDRYYYTSNFGRTIDSETWGFKPNIELMKNNRTPLKQVDKIVWYGGLDSHKVDSVLWFLNHVFPTVKKTHPYLEFHLFGNGTQKFKDPEKGVYGHGFYDGEGMPYKDSALYINPDLTGGGVKIKLLSYFESGVTFLTSPFGFEGYSGDLIDNEYCYVEESDYWMEFLETFLNTHQKKY